MNWRRWFQARPEKSYWTECGVLYNKRKHRWELVSPTAEGVTVVLTLGQERARRQANILYEYDTWIAALKRDVDLAKYVESTKRRP